MHGSLVDFKWWLVSGESVLRVAFVLSFLLLTLPAVAAPESRVVVDPDGVELDVAVYPAEGEQLFLWVLPQAGERSVHRQLAEALVLEGVEVWMVDLLDAHFLPRSNDSTRSLDGTSVAALLREAHAVTGKSVMAVASGRPAIPVLRGLRQWQLDGPEAGYVVGATLSFPNLMLGTPVAGEPADYIAEAAATSLPIFILQPEFGVYRWHLDEIVDTLRLGGSPVFTRIVPEVRDFYYLRREGPAPEEVAATEQLPGQLVEAGRLLARWPRTLEAAPLPEGVADSGANRGLVALDEPWLAESFTLPDHRGEEKSLDDYRGQVVLLNFWASWCPPCVHEIPSMNRMAEGLGEGFAIVSVNYQESAEHITAFMEEVQVDFPVLMDRDGRISAQWRVFAFPSSFVLDREGRVRYSVNSAIEWDEPEVLETVERLIEEQ